MARLALVCLRAETLATRATMSIKAAAGGKIAEATEAVGDGRAAPLENVESGRRSLRLGGEKAARRVRLPRTMRIKILLKSS